MKERGERLEYIDMTRGVAICLVMLGHIWDNPLCTLINSFHVPLFFVLSGYLFRIKENHERTVISLSSKSLYTDLRKRWKQIMIPYYVYSIVWIGFTYYILDLSIEQLKINIVWTIILYGCGALWFLPAIFFSQILFEVLKKICKKIKKHLRFLCCYHLD